MSLKEKTAHQIAARACGGQQAFAGQQGQGAAHRCARHTQPRRNGNLGQPLPGYEGAARDQLAQSHHDIVAARHGTAFQPAIVSKGQSMRAERMRRKPESDSG